MGECDGARGVWCYVRGGMGGITQALASAARTAGAEIRVSSPVARILVREGRATGVVLENGTEISARYVVSNADANVTFLNLLDPRELPENFVQDVRAIDYRSPVVKINLALSELPDFIASPGNAAGPTHQGTIHIAPTMDYIERAFVEAEAGHLPTQPMLECTLPSAVDSTLAPPGKHVMSIFAQYAPAKLADGTWDSVRDSFADTCLRTLAQYAPNIERAVIAREVLTPLDLERRFGLTGGNIFQGAMTPRQLFFRRPVRAYSNYRTPIQGLYMCGAATHPGGGVMGACGLNAAREILADTRRPGR
jgi:phytoene dehydrogenase-like protein